jgi:hypothetical protein
MLQTMNIRFGTPRRPGQPANSGCAGVFLFLFGSVFAFIGAMAAFGIWTNHKNGTNVVGIIVPAIFILIGISIAVGGIYIVRKHLRRKTSASLPGTAASAATDSNTFPALRTRKTIPGGKVQLQPETTLKQGCAGYFFFALIWNGITWAALWGISQKADSPIWVKIMLGVFALIGLLIIWAFVNTVIKLLFVGETHIELPCEPLTPGQTVPVQIYQHGSVPISKLTVQLIAKETVSYRSGTDRVTKSEEVYNEPVADQQNLVARGKSMPTTQVEIRIPEDAMPSFHSSNNQITWGLKITFEIPNRPDLDMFYPFRISAANFIPGDQS